MKQFRAFVKKEFYHILRDRRTLFILLGMPVVQIILFGFALTNEVKNARVLVLDQARDIASSEIIREIEASSYFEVLHFNKNYDELKREFIQGRAKLAIVIPSGFGTDLQRINQGHIQLLADASDPNTANTITNYASSIIMDYRDRLVRQRKLPYTIDTQIRMLYNPQLKGAYTFVPGVMAMVLMLVCTMMTAITIVREKETGTMEVMLVSPVQPLRIVLAKAVPYLVLSLFNIISILLLSYWVLEVPIRGNLFLLLGESMLFILTCLSLGLLISSATGSQQTAMFISLVALFLPTIMLSGFMFPIENMPLPLRVISHLVPAKWYYDIVSAVMIKGLGIGSIWLETLVLSGMTALLLMLSIKKFKIRLE